MVEGEGLFKVTEAAIDVTKFAFQYVIPLVLGGSGLVAIWYRWRVEREREKLKRRRELIDIWRKELLTDWDATIRIGGRNTTYAFMERPAYWSLRNHLSPSFRSQIESTAPAIRVGSNPALHPRTELSEEISRIEREWNLV